MSFVIEGTPFVSREHLRAAFRAGLVSLLQEDGLGPFILACANATADPDLGLRPALRARFAALLGSRGDGGGAGANDADRVVFEQLAVLGLDRLHDAERRGTGRWEVQFNQLRSFRPLRGGGGRVEAIRAPFDVDGFHFERPFLRKEILWAGELAGRPVSLLYNKFPFVELHGLLVPEPARLLPQFLRAEVHHWLWQLAAALGERLPGIGFGYNAYGAYSSVNHLHFHSYLREAPLPVEQPRWRHNGGGEVYPAACHAFTDAESAWDRLARLHHENRAYNLLYRPGRLYCIVRRKQGSYRHSDWTPGYGWYEMCGGVTTFGRADFERLDDAAIAAELARTAESETAVEVPA